MNLVQKLKVSMWVFMGLGCCTLSVLGGSWDLVSKNISTLIGVESTYKYGYLIYNPSY